MRLRGSGLMAAGGLLLVYAGPATAAPEREIVTAIDGYFYEPRGVATYRALAGLGDPGLVPDQPGGRESWGSSSDPLVTELVPDHWGWRCRDGYARDTYAQRIADLGKDHPYVQRWRAVQRTVFSACGDSSKVLAEMPPPLETRDRTVIRLQAQDRLYQAASLLFYRSDGPAARAAFARIAASRSPHRPAAWYMVAAIDAGTTSNRYPHRAGRPVLALREAQAILADPTLRPVHSITHALIGWLAHEGDSLDLRRVQVNLTFDALERSAKQLADDPVAADIYRRAAADADVLRPALSDPAWWLDGAIPTSDTASRALAERARHDDLAAWMLVPLAPFEKRPWIVAAEAGEDDHSALLRDFVEARDKAGRDGLEWRVLRSSSDWDAFHQIVADAKAGKQQAEAAVPFLLFRLVHDELSQRWDGDRAVDTVIRELSAYPFRGGSHYSRIVSEALRFLMAGGRIADARRLRDRIVLTADRPVEIVPGLLLLLAEDDARLAEGFRRSDYPPAELVNLISSKELTRLALRDDMPHAIRAAFARTAWTRSYALGRRIPASLDRLMRALNPEVTRNWQSHSGAHGVGERSLLLDVLATPALTIIASGRIGQDPKPDDPNALDHYQHSDNNWWCAWQPARHRAAAEDTLQRLFFADASYVTQGYGSSLRGGLEPMLQASVLWRSYDPAEVDALAAIDSAPRQLSERAIAWVEHPGLFGRREGQAEALALAVRTTRQGCQRQGGHGTYSRTAFRLLHQRFPDSPAAKRTRYWFDCSHFYYGCPAKREDDPQPSDR